MTKKRRRIEVNLEELDQIIDRSRSAPLSQAEHEKLKTAVHAMADQPHGQAHHGEGQRGIANDSR